MDTPNGMNEPNKNPGALGSPSLGHQNNSVPDINSEPKNPSPDALFYNVMPKNKAVGGLVTAELKITNNLGPTTSETTSINNLKKYRLYIIAVLVLLIGGIAAYFILQKINSNSYQPDDLLVRREPANTSEKNSQNTTTPESELTTSQEWRDKYFPNCSDSSLCGDKADPDRDGLANLKEEKLETDPNNPDSDKDGLADGDETVVFLSNPLNAHSANDARYSDSDFFRGGYDLGTGKKMTPEQVKAVSARMQKEGLREPTIKTLESVLNSFYNFSSPINNEENSATTTPAVTATPSALLGIDTSIEAKQDRDSKRSATIKNIEAALVKYQTENKAYPITSDFSVMFAKVKLYLKVATNPVDPINKDPYVYGYTTDSLGSDFTLSFYSEAAGQIIKKHAADAIKDSNAEQAAIYDDQRKNDLESLRTSLLLYSQNNIAGNQTYAFPGADKYKTALVPTYITQIPKDPKTALDYEYAVSETFDTFTLKAIFDNPATGTTGYLCNQEECRAY